MRMRERERENLLRKVALGEGVATLVGAELKWEAGEMGDIDAWRADEVGGGEEKRVPCFKRKNACL